MLASSVLVFDAGECRFLAGDLASLAGRRAPEIWPCMAMAGQAGQAGLAGLESRKLKGSNTLAISLLAHADDVEVKGGTLPANTRAA